MSDCGQRKASPPADLTRRDFLRSSAAMAAALPDLSAQHDQLYSGKPAARRKPNIVMYISDQFRWDVISAYGLNPMHLTPNLDAMARRGTLFQSHVTNQPVCAPSRACLFTGQYQTKNGVWRNGLGLQPDAVTLATQLRKSGYSANYIGKWHLAPVNGGTPRTPEARGPVAPEDRGGFDDFWQASNELEWTSHPYEGYLYDGNGQPIHYSGEYRVDFITGLARQFLATVREPFLLVVSQLEVHHQNDCNCFVAPNGYAEHYENPFVPQDLKFFPGDWQKQLANYYGCVASIDQSVGAIRSALAQRGMEDDTIFVFLSDHGCHFRTRNAEYKRSPHESSIHIPLVIQGPGFDRSLTIPELTTQIDVTPTLLSAAGVRVPREMQGRSFLPVLDRDIDGWRNEAFIQISESQCGRALRTPEWTYAVASPDPAGPHIPASDHYREEYLYNLFADPHQLLNLAGRRDDPHLVHGFGTAAQQAAADLRERLKVLMLEAGEAPAEIEERQVYS